MLLAIDIGNTNTVVGIYDAQTLLADFRLSTSEARTADEYWFHLHGFMLLKGLQPTQIQAAIMASVVPGAVQAITWAIEERMQLPLVTVGPQLKTNIVNLYDNPNEVGADRIVNAVAAYHHYRSGLIIIDFGTAATFDCVSPRGEYLGGVIAPGIGISADALYSHAAKLPRVAIRKPRQVIGKNTVESMQSGLFFGYAGLVDGIVTRMQSTCDFETTVIATGGQAKLISEASATIERVDDFLTLNGLRLLYEMNRSDP